MHKEGVLDIDRTDVAYNANFMEISSDLQCWSLRVYRYLLKLSIPTKIYIFLSKNKPETVKY